MGLSDEKGVRITIHDPKSQPIDARSRLSRRRSPSIRSALHAPQCSQMCRPRHRQTAHQNAQNEPTEKLRLTHYSSRTYSEKFGAEQSAPKATEANANVSKCAKMFPRRAHGIREIKPTARSGPRPLGLNCSHLATEPFM